MYLGVDGDEDSFELGPHNQGRNGALYGFLAEREATSRSRTYNGRQNSSLGWVE